MTGSARDAGGGVQAGDAELGQRTQWGATSVSLHLRNPEGFLCERAVGSKDLTGPDSQEDRQH